MDTSERKFKDITEEVWTGQQVHHACNPSDFRKPFNLDIGLLVKFVQTTLTVRKAMSGQEYGRVGRKTARSEPVALGTVPGQP